MQVWCECNFIQCNVRQCKCGQCNTITAKLKPTIFQSTYIFIRTSTSYFIFKAARTERAMSFIVAHHAILLALFQLCFPNVAECLKISQKVSFCNNAEDETCKVVFKQCASSSVFMTVFPCIINKIFPHFFQLQWRFF